MENEEVKVVDQLMTEEKPTEKAEEKKNETSAKAAPKKRGPKPKNDAKKTAKRTSTRKKDAAAAVKKDDVTAPAEKKAPAKREPKKSAKTTVKRTTKAPAKTTKTVQKAAPETKFNFAKTMFEYDGKQFTTESINAKVLEYLNKHPYISAEKIETFVNIGEKRIYFTVDGFGNSDFTIDL